MGGRRINVPGNFKARPTTDIAREALFNILSNRFDFEELTVLDLFSGTGSVLMEFYSRGTSRLTGVELSPLHAGFIKKNLQDFGINGVQILCTDALKFVKKAPKQHYDLIFADPPFDFKERIKVADLVFEHDLLKPQGILICEHSPGDSYESNPFFAEVRHYGKVNFSFFQKP